MVEAVNNELKIWKEKCILPAK